MTKNVFNKLVGLTLILGLLPACGSKPNPEKEEAYLKAAEKLVADESFYPILDEELFYFNSQRLDTIGVEYINEQEAVEKLMKQETWLAFTTRDFTAKEKKSLHGTRSSCPVRYPSPMMVSPSSLTIPIPTVASPSRTLHACSVEK